MGLVMIAASGNRTVRVFLVVDDITQEITGVAAENDNPLPATVSVSHAGTGRGRTVEIPPNFQGQRALPDRVARVIDDWPDLVFRFSGPAMEG